MCELTRKKTTKLSNDFKRLLKKAFSDPSQLSAYGSKSKLTCAVRYKSGHVNTCIHKTLNHCMPRFLVAFIAHQSLSVEQ